jgi:hypothetical protein
MEECGGIDAVVKVTSKTSRALAGGEGCFFMLPESFIITLNDCSLELMRVTYCFNLDCFGVLSFNMSDTVANCCIKRCMEGVKLTFVFFSTLNALKCTGFLDIVGHQIQAGLLPKEDIAQLDRVFLSCTEGSKSGTTMLVEFSPSELGAMEDLERWEYRIGDVVKGVLERNVSVELMKT